MLTLSDGTFYFYPIAPHAKKAPFPVQELRGPLNPLRLIPFLDSEPGPVLLGHGMKAL